MLLCLSTSHKGWIQEYVLKWDTKEDVCLWGRGWGGVGVRQVRVNSVPGWAGVGSRVQARVGGAGPAHNLPSRVEQQVGAPRHVPYFHKGSSAQEISSQLEGPLGIQGPALGNGHPGVALQAPCPDTLYPALGGGWGMQPQACIQAALLIHPPKEPRKRGARPTWKEHGFGARQDWVQTSCMILGCSSLLDLSFLICKMGTIPTLGVIYSSNYTAYSTIHA